MQSLRATQQRALQQFLQTRPGHQQFRLLSQTSQQPFRTRPSPSGSFKRIFTTPRPSSNSFFQSARRRFHNTARRFESTAPEPPAESLSLSQRLKRLSRDYGWSALGVYLGLTALDLPFCFLAVRWLGTDTIGHWEHVIVSWFKELVSWPITSAEGKESVEEVSAQVESVVKAPLEEVRGAGEKRVLEEESTYVVTEHGYKEAEKAAMGNNATLWTQLALAYAIHKSFIFVRIPLTAAITPKVVKTLRGWGWNIGKMPRRGSFRRDRSGVNTKGSGIKPDD